jgi:hypothetical protein
MPGQQKSLSPFLLFPKYPSRQMTPIVITISKEEESGKKVLLIDSFIALFTGMPFSNNKCCVHERFLHTHRVINGAASVCIPLGGDALI